ncbi:MAG: hypothetical protein WA951_02605 [Leeuwenhoekiella sp.]
MAQDIRELFKNDKGLPDHGLRKGHEERFESRLDSHFGKKEKVFNRGLWFKVAAVCLVIFAIGGLFFNGNLSSDALEKTQNSQVVKADASPLHLSDLSPEFKKLEDYYMASINVELAQLDLTDANKDLVDSYMTQLEELNIEYKKLNADLGKVGVNDQTVTALIDNLQLRLDLLYRLKGKLKDLKTNTVGQSDTNRI